MVELGARFAHFAHGAYAHFIWSRDRFHVADARCRHWAGWLGLRRLGCFRSGAPREMVKVRKKEGKERKGKGKERKRREKTIKKRKEKKRTEKKRKNRKERKKQERKKKKERKKRKKENKKRKKRKKERKERKKERKERKKEKKERKKEKKERKKTGERENFFCGSEIVLSVPQVLTDLLPGVELLQKNVALNSAALGAPQASIHV